MQKNLASAKHFRGNYVDFGCKKPGFSKKAECESFT